MTDEERFRLALAELQSLFSKLYGHEVHAVLIGGQVLALELLARGQSGELAVETRTGIKVSRGYTLEADLLFDLDRLPDADDLPLRLRAAGFEPARDFRWAKNSGDFKFSVDLFRPPGATEEAPCGMTEAADGGFALNHNHSIQLDVGGRPLSILVPDGPAFIAMKLAARHRRTEPKDAFDLYAYLRLMGVDTLRTGLARPELAELREELRGLFGLRTAAGVRDVLSYAKLQGEEAELLAQAVVDEFASLLKG
jgi:hypothetical protein